MTLELKFDNGVAYSLKIPKELFNSNTKEFIIETFNRWLDNEIEKKEENKKSDGK